MSDDDNERVAFNLSPEQMTAIFAEAATKERTVVEFRTREMENGKRELHKALEITEHVEELENKHT